MWELQIYKPFTDFSAVSFAVCGESLSAFNKAGVVLIVLKLITSPPLSD